MIEFTLLLAALIGLAILIVWLDKRSILELLSPILIGAATVIILLAAAALFGVIAHV